MLRAHPRRHQLPRDGLGQPLVRLRLGIQEPGPRSGRRQSGTEANAANADGTTHRSRCRDDMDHIRRESKAMRERASVISAARHAAPTPCHRSDRNLMRRAPTAYATARSTCATLENASTIGWVKTGPRSVKDRVCDDQPVVAVAVPPEEILRSEPTNHPRRRPRMAPPERSAVNPARPSSNPPRLPRSHGQTLFIFQQPTIHGVVCPQTHLRATRQRAALGTNFEPRHIGEHDVTFGRHIELEDPGRREPSVVPSHSP